jgi:hypothetical protein
MKKIVYFLSVLFLLPAAVSFAAETEKDNLAQIRALTGEIHFINLLNGLYLNREQMKTVLEIVRKQEAFDREQELEIKNFYQDYAEVLKKLRDETLENKGELSQINTDNFQGLKNRLTEAEEARSKKLKQLAKEIKDVLSENQLYIIDNYKPCIIPPKGPARIGQVEDSSAAMQNLEQIRSLPLAVYEKKKELFAQRLVARLKKRLPKGAKLDEETAQEKILAVFEQARTLSPVDFSLKKKELVDRLKIEILPHKPSSEIEEKIEKIFFVPQASKIIEEKIIQ